MNAETVNCIDYKLLGFCKAFGPITCADLEEKCAKICGVKLRVQNMVNRGWLKRETVSTMDGALTRVTLTGKIMITESGEKALQDYRHATRKDRRELWLKNAWIPIIVSFVTTVLTNYILPKLPGMIKWWIDILSKSFS